MEVIATFEPDIKTEQALNRLPKEILFTVAKETLDMSIPYIPMSNMKDHAGTLRRSSGRGEAGVHEIDNGYCISSFTEYAYYVWNMDDETTNWTTADTHSQWFAYTLKMHGQTILDTAVNREWQENM